VTGNYTVERIFAMVQSREIGKQRIEEMIRALRADVAKFDWIEKRENDTYLLQMTDGLRRRIDQCAVDQAADEPDALPALQMEIERELLVSESGTGIGFVMET
jgi:hypothetical protein